MVVVGLDFFFLSAALENEKFGVSILLSDAFTSVYHRDGWSCRGYSMWSNSCTLFFPVLLLPKKMVGFFFSNFGFYCDWRGGKINM